ncbi:transmembrane protein 208-like [Varroa jacobsoni]|uniref:Transmembrane protein 208 n=1 Tax=Varroa destructor TaxID=109461 RepID=A0A7M7KKN9_VARDE|nr:transmembrane protein 208-like [Varroa destructor]XP_022700786.1 transmembrane protein 208-like [Varroa jacobsoni]
MVVVEPRGKKEATKGQKQVVTENRDTIRFYVIMSSSGITLYLFAAIFIFTGGLTSGLFTILSLTALVQAGCIFMMHSMATPMFSETGQLLDGGTDLNMKNGFCEYLKDLVILSSFVEVLAMFSNYFWCLMLLVPIYAFYLLWIKILGPWFFAPPGEEEELSEKKQRKLDRKMRRMQSR